MDISPATDYRERTVLTAAGAELFVRCWGTGSPVVLLGGVGETSAAWHPLVAALAWSNTVVIPDLRGMGRSSKPLTGYEKRTQAIDVRSVLSELGFGRCTIVGHGVGGQVAYAYASRYAGDVERLVIVESRLAAVAPWEALVDPEQYVHFVLRGTDTPHVMNVERGLRARFRAELDTAPDDREHPTEAFYDSKAARATVDRPFSAGVVAAVEDIRDNLRSQKTKLTMPVLAIGGARSVGALQATIMRQVASDVRAVVVPDAGHWPFEERPDVIVPAIVDFLRGEPG